MKTPSTLFRWGLMAIFALALIATPAMAVQTMADSQVDQVAIATTSTPIAHFDKVDTVQTIDGVMYEASVFPGHIIAADPSPATYKYTMTTNTVDSFAAPKQAAMSQDVQTNTFHYLGQCVSHRSSSSTAHLTSLSTATTALGTATYVAFF